MRAIPSWIFSKNKDVGDDVTKTFKSALPTNAGQIRAQPKSGSGSSFVGGDMETNAQYLRRRPHEAQARNQTVVKLQDELLKMLQGAPDQRPCPSDAFTPAEERTAE